MIYVYAVNNGHVVDAALGYFINPLVSVALGVLIFRERLNRWQLGALAIAVVAVVVLTVRGGAAAVVAVSAWRSRSALYGAVKKVVRADPRVSVGRGGRDRDAVRARLPGRAAGPAAVAP